MHTQFSRPQTGIGSRQRRRGVERVLASRSLQTGQSLVETAIALIVLVPLAAGVMLLGQYMHIRQQTQSAARAAAWAATVDPALTQQSLPERDVLERKLRNRQFSETGQGLSQDDGNPERLGDPMLTTFSGNELLKSSGVSLTVYQQESSHGYLDTALGKISAITKSLGNLPPNTQGLVTAEVHALSEPITDSEDNPLTFLDPLDTRRLDFSAKTVLLADTWDAAGGGEDRNGKEVSGAGNRVVRNVIQPLVPTNLFGDQIDDVFSDVINVLGKIPVVDDLFTPGWKNFHLGRMAPDAVPADKLVKYEDGH